MGRNKNQQKRIQKSRAVFKVAGSKTLKAKTKAKQVTSNLKKMNFKTKEDVVKCDEQLKNVQTLLREKSKPKEKVNSKEDCTYVVDMDEAAKEFEKL